MTPKEEKLAWIQEKRKIKQRYVFLTDKDLTYEQGKKDVMLGMLQKRLGKTKEQLQEIIAGL
ncbi:MAG: general stress protein CsbD [Saprospiraceae bacterium]|nr:general stress protein CsbD [Candidatus Opimibacter iunctus]